MSRRFYRYLLATAVSLLPLYASKAQAACTALTDGVVPLARFSSTGSATVFTESTSTATAIVEGAVAYDTTNDLLKVCDGSNWLTAGGGGGSSQWVDGTGGAIYYNGGNVGIGTTSPTNLLSLGGDAARTIWMERHATANTAGNSLTVQSGGATSGATDKNGGNLVLSSGTATGTGSSKIEFKTHPAGSTGTADTTAATAMTILGNGNVGIGVTIPGYALTLSPQMRIQNAGGTVVTDLTSTSVVGSSFLALSAATSYLLLASSTQHVLSRAATFTAFENMSGSEWMRITSTGNVGIGTPSPTSKLHVQKDDIVQSESGTGLSVGTRAGMQLRLGSNTAGLFSEIQSSQTGVAYKPLALNPYGGNVGIGTTTPTQRLDVTLDDATVDSAANVAAITKTTTGTATAGHGANLLFRTERADGLVATSAYLSGILTGVGGGVGTQGALAFHTADTSTSWTEKMRITSGGYVGIGTSTPLTKLDVTLNSSASFPSYPNPTLTVARFSNADGSASLVRNQGYGAGPEFTLERAEGTAATPANLLSGIALGTIGWRGYDGAGGFSTNRATIQSRAAEDWSTTAQGSNLIFSTTASASTSISERLRIDHNGNVGIGQTSPQSLLSVGSGGYAQFEKTSPGVPTGTDCDAANESGRVVFDTTNNHWYVCEGTGGWVNASTAGSGTLSGGTSGYLGVWSGATSLSLSSTGAGNQLFWDGTNHRLGIGTATPSTKLDVSGNIGATTFNSQILSNGGQTNSLVVGAGASTNMPSSVVVGQGASANGTSASFGVAIGRNASVTDTLGVAIGGAASSGRGTALGYLASNSGSAGVAIGESASNSGSSVAIGTLSIASTYGTAIGRQSNAPAYTVAIGIDANASASTTTGVALGRGATLTAGSQFVVGGNGGLAIANTYLGSGVTDPAPASHTINATGGSGTDIAGANLTLAGGRPTGSGTGGSLIFQTAAAGASGTTLRALAERMRIDSTGNVGIGTTAPAFKFVALGGASQFGQTTNGQGLRLQTTGTMGEITGINHDNNAFNGLQFTTSGTPTMYITAGNKVGIGQSAPESLLSVGSGGYAQFEKTFTSVVPTAGDCDAANEAGRVTYRTDTNTWYVCEGTGGWGAVSGGGSSTLATLTDVTITSVANNDMLRYETATSKWKNVNMNTALGTTTMVPSWPDAIRCNDDSSSHTLTFVLAYSYPGSITAYRYLQNPNVGSDYLIAFNTSNGTYNSGSSSLSGYSADCGRSLSALAADGKTFNFIGTSGIGPDLFDFTEFKDAMALDASTDIVLDGAEVLSITNSGTGNSLRVNDDGTTTDTTPFLIDASGNVGVGTTSPTSKLHVRTGTNENLRINTGVSVTGAVSIAGINDAGNANTPLEFRSGGVGTIFSTGNVGIGTTSPAGQVHLYTNEPTLVLHDDGWGPGGGMWRMHVSNSNGKLAFQYNTAVAGNFSTVTEALTILNSGNVGIGTPTPSATLHVNGTMNVAGSAIFAGAGNSTQYYYACLSGGLVLNYGASCAVSDIRYKKNIETLETDSVFKKLSQLRPVEFDWIDEGRGKGRQIGLIAQEVEKVYPSVVSTGSDGYKTVSYQHLVSPLIKAVQELKAERDNDQDEIQALRTQLKAANDNDAAQDAAIDALRLEINALKAAR